MAAIFPTPVIFYFHGAQGNISQGEQAQNSANAHKLHEYWPEAHVVYAEGRDYDSGGILTDQPMKLGWILRFPYIYTECKEAYEDIDYIMNVLEFVRTIGPVDDQKRFAVGHSSGGFFTLSLMELLPEVFHAYVAHACYARFKIDKSTLVCKPGEMNHHTKAKELIFGTDMATHPRPVMYMFGQSDDLFKEDGPDNPTHDQCVLSTLKQLAVRNNCKEYTPPNPATLASITYEPNLGEAGARVVWHPFSGDHHAWNSDLSQSQAIVDFLKSC